MQSLAPIVLFVYNRPQHTIETLKALKKNILAESTKLYIFSDGPKENISIEELTKIEEVRKIIRQELWCGEVEIFESDINLGLAKSIIDGVSLIVRKYGKIIVLEDDIVPAIGFLKYMNDALDLYKNETSVGCIHAWNYKMNKFNKKTTTFFLKGADCWGWGTWEESWNLFNENSSFLISEIERLDCSYSFNRNGTIDFLSMLRDQMTGKIDSWAIRWHASLFLNDKYCLHPVKPIVKNIGLDGTGTHCNEINEKQELTEFIELDKIPIVEHEKFFEHFKNPNKGFFEKIFQTFKKR